MKLNTLLLILISIAFICGLFKCNGQKTIENRDIIELDEALNLYHSQLEKFREKFGGTYHLPDVSFFLFGMGNSEKYLYKSGKLINSYSGEIVYDWSFKSETLAPNEYAVYGTTEQGDLVLIQEDEDGIWINDSNGRQNLLKKEGHINLPGFEGHRYSEILRVLHQEIAVNILDSNPLPNYFVYKKPWRRDAAMMAMCLYLTDNLTLIKDWVLNISDAYDMNNGVMQGKPEEEADNLGQTLYLLSLFTDKEHITVKNILNELPKWEVAAPHTWHAAEIFLYLFDIK